MIYEPNTYINRALNEELGTRAPRSRKRRGQSNKASFWIARFNSQVPTRDTHEFLTTDLPRPDWHGYWQPEEM